MLDLPNDFLLKSKADLEILSLKIKANLRSSLPHEFVHEAFRKFHTIKGTAQTFGFVPAGKIAHALEDMLAGGVADDSAGKKRLLHGIDRLIGALDNNARDEPENMPVQTDSARDPSHAPTIFISNIPLDEFQRFADHEKDRLISAAADKRIASIEASFETAALASQFTDFRERLAAECEIIASFPSQSRAGDGTNSFRTYFAADENSVGIKKLAEEFSARIDLHTIPPGTHNAFCDVIRRLGIHAAELGRPLAKDVRIVVSVNALDVPANRTSLIFDILLHLVRNAIDHHGGDRVNITIALTLASDGLMLKFSDDGSGIDVELVRKAATEKGLISPKDTACDSEIKDMIFLPGLSTAKQVTEVSGRGYGLDAVKRSVTDGGDTESSQARLTAAKDILIK